MKNVGITVCAMLLLVPVPLPGEQKIRPKSSPRDHRIRTTHWRKPKRPDTRGRADPARCCRNRNQDGRESSNGSSIRTRCILKPSQGNEAPRPAGKRRASILSQLDMALASTTAITLPVLNQQDLVAESTEARSAWLEDLRSAPELEPRATMLRTKNPDKRVADLEWLERARNIL